MFSVSQIVQQFKQNWLAEIDPAAIEHACRGGGPHCVTLDLVREESLEDYS